MAAKAKNRSPSGSGPNSAEPVTATEKMIPAMDLTIRLLTGDFYRSKHKACMPAIRCIRSRIRAICPRDIQNAKTKKAVMRLPFWFFMDLESLAAIPECVCRPIFWHPEFLQGHL